MKTAILILALVLSVVFIAGCTTSQTNTQTPNIQTSSEVTPEQATQAVDSGLINETDDVSIGEMI